MYRRSQTSSCPVTPTLLACSQGKNRASNSDTRSINRDSETAVEKHRCQNVVVPCSPASVKRINRRETHTTSERPVVGQQVPQHRRALPHAIAMPALLVARLFSFFGSRSACLLFMKTTRRKGNDTLTLPRPCLGGGDADLSAAVVALQGAEE